VILTFGHVLRAHEACVPLLAVVVIKKGSQIFEYGRGPVSSGPEPSALLTSTV
jgi:hypothetical protein